MQAGPSEDRAYPADGSRPGSPKRLGRTAVHPAAATRRPNSATRGVMPGISLITITAGPEPDAEDVAPLAVSLEGVLGEACERRLPPACIARRHWRTVASSVVAGPTRSLDPRQPVLVGLGAASDGAPVAELMTDAVRAAAADAGAPALLTSRRVRRS